jgi:hypothetical protein
VVRFDVAGSRAAITADTVAVVAGLAPILLHDPISAIGPRIDERIALAGIGHAGLAMDAGVCGASLQRYRDRGAARATSRRVAAAATGAALVTRRDDGGAAASPTYGKEERAQRGKEEWRNW